MLKYKCLILDHDDTVVQSEKTLGFPCFVQTMSHLRPNITLTLDEYVRDCHSMGFYNLCRQKYGFTEEEMAIEYADWKHYIRTHIPEPFPGIRQIIHRQKELGGILCVVSHSSEEIIRRDYITHFALEPDAIYGCDLPESMQKPHPYPLQAIMDRYHLQTSDLLVLDDSRLGFDMAQPLGISTAFAAWGKIGFDDVLQEMSRLCNFTFHSTADFEAFLFPTLDSCGIIPYENGARR